MEFLLGSSQGGYYLGSQDKTSYQGLTIFKDWELIKLVDEIKVNDEVLRVEEKDFNSYDKINKDSEEKFYYDSSNDFVYELKGDKKLTLFLDCRKIHDYDDKGRIYHVEKIDEGIRVSYKKYEDNNLKDLMYTVDFVIVTKNKFEIKDEWVEKNYWYDKKRNTKSNLYVYKSLIFEGRNIKLKFKAIPRKNPINKNLKKNDDYYNALKKLTINQEVKGILAGYPWFYQLWARDELISLKPYIMNKEFSFAKSVLKRHLNNINEEGMVSNRYPSSILGSIDSTGWLSKRIRDYYQIKKISSSDKKEIKEIYQKLAKAEKKLRLNRMREGMIYNHALETWMDTGKEESVRKGFRVEIQFLYYELLETLNYLGEIIKEDKKYDTDSFKKIIRHNFLTREGLIDGIANEKDYTKRPNVFLAYYINKSLLTKKEWELTFDKVIEECWLPWGGLSSISKKNRHYTKQYTGMDNKSYHHGDSWYYINNIAGITLTDLNKKKYKKYIKKIYDASVKDYKTGLINNCSEISSSNERTSEGCLAQAWSASTLYELNNIHNF